MAYRVRVSQRPRAPTVVPIQAAARAASGGVPAGAPPAAAVERSVAGWLARHHARSVLTARAYGVAWYGRVRPYVEALGGPGGVGPAEAEAILRDLGRRLGPSARNVTASAMSSLWKELQRQGLVKDNPWELVRREPVRETVGERLLGQDQVLAMLRAARPGVQRELVRLLYVSGARISEVCRDPRRDRLGQRTGLYWRDVRRRSDGSAVLSLYGKGGKTRYVRIPPPVLQGLWALSETHAPDEPVFRTRTGAPLDRYRGTRLVRAAARAAGIQAPVSAHWLRHCHAAHALAAGAPINVVQATLGHARLDTTGVYTRLAGEGSSGDYLPHE
jgi:site-specific recombinase XerD